MAISKRGKKWRAFITVKDDAGNFRNKTLGTFDTQFEAMRSVENAKKEMNQESNKSLAYELTFYEYFEWYFLRYKKESCSKKNTRTLYEYKKLYKEILG